MEEWAKPREEGVEYEKKTVDTGSRTYEIIPPDIYEIITPKKLLNDIAVFEFLKTLASLSPNGRIFFAMQTSILTKFAQQHFGELKGWIHNSNPFTDDMTIFPINIRNVHWVVIIIEGKNKRAIFYDSMGINRDVAHVYLNQVLSFLQWLSGVLKEHFDINEWSLWDNLVDRPKQAAENYVDCGAYILWFVLHHLFGVAQLDDAIAKTNMDAVIRRSIGQVVFKGQLVINDGGKAKKALHIEHSINNTLNTINR